MLVSAAERRSRSVAVPLDPLIDWLLCFGAFVTLVLSVQFGTLGAGAFLASSFLIAFRRLGAALLSLSRNSFLFAIPLLALISVSWSDYPAETLKASIELICTTIAGICLASCVRPAVLTSALAVALAFVIVACLINGSVGYDPDGNSPLIGLFESKNQLAGCAAFQLLTAVALVVDGSRPLLLRAFGLVSALIAPIALLAAQSAGALAFCVPSIAAVLGARAISAFSRANRGVLLTIGLTLAVPVVVGMLSFFDGIDAMLDLLGKDSTLTGRAYLWNQATQYISERPLLGVGYQAFWRLENQRAQELWFVNHVAAGAGFNFHNLLYNTGVELGLIGIAIVIATFCWVMVNLLLTLLSSPKPFQCLAIGIVVYSIGISFVEAALYYQFNIGTVLFLIGYCYLKPLRHQL